MGCSEVIGAAAKSRPITGLFHNGDQVRVDDPLVGSHQVEAMNASGSHNHLVKPICQRTSQCDDFVGYFGGEGNNTESGICVQCSKQVSGADADPLAPLRQQRNFEQTDRAYADKLLLPHSILEDTTLLSR